jgi:hypothetical protein
MQHPTHNNVALVDTQAKVDQVKLLMEKNVAAALHRHDSLIEIDEKAEQCNRLASTFHTKATGVKRKMCYRNVKIILLAVVLLFVVVLAIYLSSR